MDMITLFKDFGYPALVTGVLLWMFSSRLERLTIKIDELNKSIAVLIATIGPRDKENPR